MPEDMTPHSPGPSRRTLLKASAWSLPVVAVAAAAPLAAASAAGDIFLAAQARGATISATGPDGTTLELAVPAGFDVTTLGTAATPAGATITLGFDNRLLGGATLSMDRTPATQAALETIGNVTTVTFTLPLAIPSNGTTIPIELAFATFNGATWVGDARPLTVTVAPPAGSTDPDSGNNVVVMLPRYTPAP